MTNPSFIPYNGCKECPLSEDVKSPGLPTRPLIIGGLRRNHALLIVGEAPGYYEDLEGKSWVGKAGKLLHRWFLNVPFSDHADVYLTNACRCRPVNNETPTRSQINKCRQHLLDDVSQLVTTYDGHVTLLCTGASAAYAIAKSTLAQGFKVQGVPQQLVEGLSLPAFYTYHPAALLRKRDPTKVRAVSLHLKFLYDVLAGVRKVETRVAEPTRAPVPPTEFPPIFALDIETYGVLQDQTVFHPAKSRIIDGVPATDQIVIVSVAWPDRNSAIFIWDAAPDRFRLRQWIKQASTHGSTILGQNMVYDISYLRYCDKILKGLLKPGSIKLDDLSIINHLDFEQRPERSLKNISTIFGISNYTTLQDDGKILRANSALTKRLWQYGATDALNTLMLKPIIEDRIRGHYGKKSPKLSPLCADLRSELLWNIVHMSESGTCIDLDKIKAAHATYRRRVEKIWGWTKRKHDLKLSGTGTKKDQLKIIREGLGEDLISHPEVVYTKKTKELGTGKDNLNLILGKRHKSDPLCYKPRLLQAFKDSQTMFTHFTTPLLYRPEVGLLPEAIRHPRKAMAYPSWYPVPLFASKDDTGSVGGTIQGRITCRAPALQTNPKIIKGCYTSRFFPGFLLHDDMSQIELRVAALLSGDPVMLSEYRHGVDRHAQAALTAFPHLTGDEPDFKSKWRQAAKTLNFLVLYKGGGRKYQETLRADWGIEMPISTCKAAIENFDRRYFRFRAWQKELIQTACRRKYIEVPTGWSRSFSGSPSVIQDTYTNEICNFPIQCIAAQLMLSAQYQITCDLWLNNFRTVVAMQTYDHLLLDGPADELPKVRKIVDKHLTNPPLLAIIAEHVGRTIPLEHEAEVLHYAQSPST